MCAYILVAEDDAMQAELIRRLLVKEGHTAVVVSDGRAALDEARNHRPDLVILDVMLLVGVGGSRQPVRPGAAAVRQEPWWCRRLPSASTSGAS
ncbi:CheY-like chemotaxis protein [Streptomyces sp. LBL]|nr:CheY-like chemotaxis protein [Streptomyces sp. LBL]